MGIRGPQGAVGPPGPQGEIGASGPIGEVLSPWPYQNVKTLFILHTIRTKDGHLYTMPIHHSYEQKLIKGFIQKPL